MAFPGSNDILATTMERRSGRVQDEVLKNNAGLAWIKKRGNVKTISGGTEIVRELAFAENGNFGWYSGYDYLPASPQDMISAARFPLKQAACAVLMSGTEDLQNSGEAAVLDLMAERLKVTESTMQNKLSEAFYSDGTAFGGKQIGGLGSMLSTTPTTGTVGGIDRSLWPFWRNKVVSVGANPTSANILGYMNQTQAKTVRGSEKADLIIFDDNMWGVFLGAMQDKVQITSTESAKLGFASLNFMGADVVLDGGIGGFCPPWTGYFISTKHLFWQPHARRNMVPLKPSSRVPVNQDMECQILAWAGNMTVDSLQSMAILKGY